ncbi:MAG: GNAT family N-acetyltransferase [Anaerolineae bacterium]|nr:GNAT family N-acetyltransferase [Thermoflexales bacterium]MDW8407548.1 GNAT family N-acetyltransferase [Anaerolineae bacterium]
MCADSPARSFSIVRARLFDLPAIRRLERVCFPNDAYDALTLLSLALTPGVLRLKAVANEKLVGFAAGERQPRASVGWIVTIGVLPEFQGRGIGRALLLEIERQMNARCVRLTVRRSNTRAIALYTRCGYRWVTTSRHYYHDGEDGLIMEKELW